MSASAHAWFPALPLMLDIQVCLHLQVGFIGLGQMGSRMARNLMHGGHDLLVYDSSSARLREFCKDTGAASASSPSGMAAEAGAGRSHHYSVSTSMNL